MVQRCFSLPTWERVKSTCSTFSELWTTAAARPLWNVQPAGRGKHRRHFRDAVQILRVQRQDRDQCDIATIRGPFQAAPDQAPGEYVFHLHDDAPRGKMEREIFGYRLIEAVVRISLPLESERFDILRAICVDNAKIHAPACTVDVV